MNRFKRYRIVGSTLAVIVILVSTTSFAQEITGSISGTVADVSGSVISNATVTITNTDKNIVARTITTSSSGEFVATLLPIGHYTMEVSAPGFRKAARTGIELNVSDKLSENFSLQVGSSSEVVTVEANPVQVETQTAAAQGLISGTEVRQLSLNNRNYEQLVSLMPGVVYGGSSDQLYIGNSNPAGAANVVSFSINGGRNSANNWTIDGADNVDRGSNLTLLNYPSIDAIAEFKVLRGLYAAEFGRGAGQVNVITRSGESLFHADAYEFVRNNAFVANDYFRKRSSNTFNKTHPSPLRYNDFGYTIGGPVYIPGLYNKNADKTFFFFSQEYRRQIQYATSTVTLPTAEMKNGVLPVDTCVGFNASRTTCTQVLPAGTPITNLVAIDPVAAAYIKDVWKYSPNPDNATTGSTVLSVRNQFNARQDLVRIDHIFGPKLSIFGRYLHDSIPTQEPFGQFSTGTTIPNVATTSTNSPGKSWVFRATSALKPNLLLEAGYSYSYGAEISRNIGAINPGNSPDVASAIRGKLPYTVTLARIPTVTAVGVVSGSGPYDDYNRDHNFFGDLSWIKGKHNFKFGGTWHNYSKTENTGNGNNPGSFTFDSTGKITGGNNNGKDLTQISNAQTWANFLTGTVSSFAQIATDLTPYIRMKQFEGFAQDEWRIFRRLTMTYGVRYSYFPQPHNENSQVLNNFDPSQYKASQAVAINPATGLILIDSQGNPTVGNVLNGMIYASGALKNSPYGDTVGEQTKGSWAPRLGFAFDPRGDGKTSIRAGYGMFFQATLVGTYEQSMFLNPPYSAALTITGDATSGQFPTWQNPTGGVPSLTAAKTPKTIRGVQTTGDVPYTQQWSLDIQHDFGSGLLFDVGYYGSKDTHLLGMVDINQPLPGAYITAGISASPLTSSNITRINAIRPYLGYGPINSIRPWFTGNYNSLQTSTEKRFKSGSIAKFNYTWSHALTTSMSDRSNAPANTYDIRQNYGPSALDRRHVFTATYVYALPWFQGKKGVVGHLLGGWETSGIFSAVTGLPLNISGNAPSAGVTSIDAAGQGCIGPSQCPIRPNEVGDPNSGAPHTVAQWFNTAAFATNRTPGAVSSARSGAILGPGYWRADASIFKQVKFTERFGMQLRFETFNVFNHENFNTIGTTFLSPTYGQVTASRDPRLIQLGAKLHF